MSSGEVEQELIRIKGEIDALVNVEEWRKLALQATLGRLATFSLEQEENLRMTQEALLEEADKAAIWNETVETTVLETERALDQVLFGSPTQEAMTMHGMWVEFKRARENAFSFSQQAKELLEQVLREAHQIRVDDPPVAQAHLDAHMERLNQLLNAALVAATEAANYGSGSGDAGDQYRPRL